MSKINSDGLQEIIKNIKNPLESIYNKMEKNGSLKWSDMKDEYDFIYRFLDTVQNTWDVSEHTKEDVKVIINNKVYKEAE